MANVGKAFKKLGYFYSSPRFTDIDEGWIFIIYPARNFRRMRKIKSKKKLNLEQHSLKERCSTVEI
jgi:hypothetical protein